MIWSKRVNYKTGSNLSLDIEKIEKLLSPIIDPKNKNEILTRGLPASLGVVSGMVVFDFKTLIKFKNKNRKQS
ncbi:MAG: hypothetical protein CM15mP29_1880 [Alphaproteobacteria bacterium]|nr:MAG: hypothetical protein CM15mP29_1880 [Alphaproteobacteria bacterium]